MKKETTTKNEKAKLEKALKDANKKIEQLAKKLEKSKSVNDQLKKELKKNNGQKIILSKEQEQVLSSLLKGIHTRNL
jgi:septal ring factor EnvC (AmiA/AmiB activator)